MHASRDQYVGWLDPTRMYTLHSLAGESGQTVEWTKKYFIWPEGRDPVKYSHFGNVYYFYGQDLIDYIRKHTCPPKDRPKKTRQSRSKQSS